MLLRHDRVSLAVSLSVSADVCILVVADSMRVALSGVAFLPLFRLSISCHETLSGVSLYV